MKSDATNSLRPPRLSSATIWVRRPPRPRERRFIFKLLRAIEGDIASGDKFFADRADLSALLLRLPTIAAVDMESAAVAQVCYEYSVPFTVVRTISDDAGKSAVYDFSRFLTQVASAYSYGILKQLFETTIHLNGVE
jgi:adenosylhomocysteine nucleosidase